MFGDEPWKLFDVYVVSSQVNTLKATTVGVDGQASLGENKIFAISGFGVNANDRVSWAPYSAVNDADCNNRNLNLTTGMQIMQPMTGFLWRSSHCIKHRRGEFYEALGNIFSPSLVLWLWNRAAEVVHQSSVCNRCQTLKTNDCEVCHHQCKYEHNIFFGARDRGQCWGSQSVGERPCKMGRWEVKRRNE